MRLRTLARKKVDEVLNPFLTFGHMALGEEVSQLQHALQCAWYAEQDNAPDYLVIAALLHDIGHLLTWEESGKHPEETVITKKLARNFWRNILMTKSLNQFACMLLPNVIYFLPINVTATRCHRPPLTASCCRVAKWTTALAGRLKARPGSVMHYASANTMSAAKNRSCCTRFISLSRTFNSTHPCCEGETATCLSHTVILLARLRP